MISGSTLHKRGCRAMLDPRTKESIFPPFEPGSELGWGARGIPPKSHWHYVVVQDPDWDYKTFNFDTDLARGEKIENDTLNATSPDLKAFFSRGGKLLQYHGWSDTVIAPGNSVNYYTRVLDAMRQVTKVDESYRLFMVPGMGHCGDGEGP